MQAYFLEVTAIAQFNTLLADIQLGLLMQNHGKMQLIQGLEVV